MFNLLPGQGLGFTPSKMLAFGLGYVTGEAVDTSGGGGGYVIYDDGYRTLINDDNEIVEIITIITGVLE